ncbi:hypothetical protein CAEBREN_22415 [Caenorhabditis brenneri]|uniref:Uncharacterized protein n=1 Tax=Caenorhabditis brenneri TaxID=135651 RepID=G0MBW2_CAEBE|nr:hypothetical protein CAEBREN_22415 [Caenorhabditis brenneri]
MYINIVITRMTRKTIDEVENLWKERHLSSLLLFSHRSPRNWILMLIHTRSLFGKSRNFFSFIHKFILSDFFAMSKEFVLSTPIIFPYLITRKLDTLSAKPKEVDLNAIRELLDVVQQERVVSEEEVQEWKILEENILENQNNYKNETEEINNIMKYSKRFYWCYTYPAMFCFCILEILTDEHFLGAMYKTPIVFFNYLLSWPVCFIAVAIYLYYSYGPTPVLVLSNLKVYLQNSMTSIELQSRQEALLNGWEQLRKERKKVLESDTRSFIVRFANIIFFASRLTVCSSLMKEESIFFRTELELTETQLLIDFFLSFSFFAIFFGQYKLEQLELDVEFPEKLINDKPIELTSISIGYCPPLFSEEKQNPFTIL